MDLPPLDDVPFVPVPGMLFSDETGAPFEKCCICSGHLLADGTGYLIEKGFHRGETAFEYAICFDCHGRIKSELSQASLKRVEHYFDERVDMVARRRGLIAAAPDDPAPWFSKCLLSGDDLGDEYQVFAQCDGGDLLFGYLPYAIGGRELENLAQILSKETRERLDDFIDDVLGVPGDGLRLPVMI
ncbi:hypothetical protein [Luteolibacter marinus]|uniref:hypothetical protein n=1 Tax=Luteolibacter marinus TaxID=2776705 RepID=UPI001868EA3D|nr:hypothetical protein [Luteolibacter marinus]